MGLRTTGFKIGTSLESRSIVSRALFVFSYNDPSAIDRILLDRIHRVNFEPLTIKDKLAICTKHILPEIYNGAGLTDEVLFQRRNLGMVDRKLHIREWRKKTQRGPLRDNHRDQP